ncbi:MAG: class I SAM-dependent methyltransferase [Magnetococcales bacterium]|nr:class I SAM-dependent methyltransferase [Magnetococcales bacterium]
MTAITVATIDDIEKQWLLQRLSTVYGYLLPAEGYVLYRWAKEGPGTGIVVEIGSFMGLSTCWLAAGSQVAQRGKVVACDSFCGLDQEHGSTLPQFQDNVKQMGLHALVETRVGTSAAIVRGWAAEQKIRLLFIDADHSYNASRSDLMAWFEYVEPGGIIAFHDINTLYGCSRLYGDLLHYNPAIEEVAAADSLRLVRKPLDPVVLSWPQSTEAAWHDYQQRLSHNPSDQAAWRQLATLYFEGRQFGAAEQCYRNLMQWDPSGQTYAHLSLILAMQGRIAESQAYYEQAVGMDPQLQAGPIQLLLAQICLSLGDNDAAEGWYRRILATAPSLVSALFYNNLATSLQRQGRSEEAIDYYWRAVAMDAKMTGAYHSIATLLAQQGHYQRAKECCHQALTVDPQSAPLWSLLAIISARQGREEIDQALACLQRAVAIEPTDVATQERLGGVRTLLQQRLERIDQLAKPLLSNDNI